MAQFTGVADASRRQAAHAAAVASIGAHAAAVAQGDDSKRAEADTAHKAYAAETRTYNRFTLPE